MTNLLEKWYGNLTAVNVATELPRAMQTGDLHIAVYDFGNEVTYVLLFHALRSSSQP